MEKFGGGLLFLFGSEHLIVVGVGVDDDVGFAAVVLGGRVLEVDGKGSGYVTKAIVMWV